MGWMYMSKRKIYKAFAWIAVGLWMGLIFYLSHQPASASSQLSGGMMDFFINTVEGLVPFLKINWTGFHYIVRKSAHLTAYFILGVLVLHALKSSKMASWHNVLIAFFICVIYATSDEVHQLFIPGRSGEITDVLIDSGGAAGGIGVYQLISRIRKRG